MHIHTLSGKIGGWFIGNFNPTCYDTKEFEVALKRYIKGDEEPTHYHSIASEFTIVVNGIISMNDIRFKTDDIIEVEPGEVIRFKAITDCVTVVVKVPSCAGDKYLA